MLVLINNNDQDINTVILDEDTYQSDIKIQVGLISQMNGKIFQNYILSNPQNIRSYRVILCKSKIV